MADQRNNISLSALKITLIYLVVAALWIAFTDQLLNSLVPDPEYLSTLQTYKGWIYVFLTSLGLFYLIKKHGQQVSEKEKKISELSEKFFLEKELSDILFERIPVLINIYDPDLEEFRINKEFEKVTGWTNEEIQDTHFMEACFPDLEIRKKVAEFMKKPGIGWKEFPLTTKSGEEVPTSWTNIKLTDNTSVGIGIDMSEIKASQAKIRESRELLEKVFESLESSLIILDYESRTIVDCNKSTEELFGYSKEELKGRSTRILHVSEKKFEEFDEIGRDALAEKGVFQTEFQMQRKDGSIFHSDHTVSLVYDEEGKIDKVVSLVRDITDQKEYEHKLKKRQERLQRSQEIGKIGDWEFDLQTEEIYWSKMLYRIFERDPELGPPSFDQVQQSYYGEDSKKHNIAVERAAREGQPYDIDLRLQTEKGNEKYIRAIGIPEKDESGDVIKLRGIVQNITERKKREQELSERNTFIETTLENIPIGVAVNTLDDGKVTLMNKQFSEIYGWPKEILKDVDTFFAKVYPDEEFRAKIKKQIMDDIDSRKPERMNWRGIPIYTQEGNKRIVNAKVIPLYDQNLMLSTVIDVTEQKKLKQKLSESEKKYRHLFENNPEPMWIYNPDTLEFVEVNQAAIDHYGYTEEEFLNMTLLDIRPKKDVEAVKRNVKENVGNQSYSEEWTHLKKDGTKITVELSAADVRYLEDKTYRLILINDVTEQKRVQEKIIQSVIEGEDRERKRVALELHDGLGQYLVAANMNFQSMQDEVAKLPEKRKKQFKKGLSHLKKALSETRSIAYDLMPKAITDYGLIVALKNLIQDLRESTNIEFSFDSNCEKLDLNNRAEVNIYRILQETISNAVQHSECSHISITIEKTNDTLRLSVEDDGKGVELDSELETQGLGLRSIKTRVKSLNGSLNIESEPEKGMETVISIPDIDSLKQNGEI